MKKLINRRKNLLQRLVKHGDFMRGSINYVCGRCSRAKCICEKKSAAKAYSLTYKDSQQKTKIVYLAKDRLRDAQQLLVNYTMVRKIIEQIIGTNIEIFKKGGSAVTSVLFVGNRMLTEPYLRISRIRLFGN